MLIHHLEKLRHFRGVVKSGSIRAYSLENRLSQPAISKCIQVLESNLGTSLILRSRNGVTLTQSGQLLFDFADTLISSTDELEVKIKSSGQLRYTGRLRMGVYTSIAVYFVPSFFKFLQIEQGSLIIDLVTAPSATLVDMVRSSKVDFAISINPPVSKELFSHTLFKDTYSLYRKSGIQTSQRSKVVYTVLGAKDQNGKNLEKHIRSFMTEAEVVECGDFEVVKAMIENDCGVGVLPDKVAEMPVSLGKIERHGTLNLLQKIGPHNVDFICRKSKADDSVLRWVLNQLQLMLN